MSIPNENDKYISVAVCCGCHPIMPCIKGGVIMTKREWILKYYLQLNLLGVLVETYQDRFSPGVPFGCTEAFEKDVEAGYFIKVG